MTRGMPVGCEIGSSLVVEEVVVRRVGSRERRSGRFGKWGFEMGMELEDAMCRLFLEERERSCKVPLRCAPRRER